MLVKTKLLFTVCEFHSTFDVVCYNTVRHFRRTPHSWINNSCCSATVIFKHDLLPSLLLFLGVACFSVLFWISALMSTLSRFKNLQLLNHRVMAEIAIVRNIVWLPRSYWCSYFILNSKVISYSSFMLYIIITTWMEIHSCVLRLLVSSKHT